MPSNVRRYEKSCKRLHKYGDQFYECQTCDPKLQLYFCGQCYINGQHSGHQISSVCNKHDIYFCNCGDVTGLICCSVHKRQAINSADRPLHVNESALNHFISLYNCEKQYLSKLCRVNQIRKLDSRANDYAMIKRYFENSNVHKRHIKLGDVWTVYRKDRELAFVEKGFDQRLRLLLWHGTKRENLVKILQKGLQRPYEELGRSTAHGSMFGKGIYFADRVSKSSQYSDSIGSGLLFLCEVALGKMYKVGTSNTFESVPKGYESIRGVGLNIPDPDGDSYFDESIHVLSEVTVPNPNPSVTDTALLYNEYIVFNPARILIKFIVQFENTGNFYSSAQTYQPLIVPASRTIPRSTIVSSGSTNTLVQQTKNVSSRSISRPLSQSSSYRTNAQSSHSSNQYNRPVSQTAYQTRASTMRTNKNNSNCILL